MFCLNQLSQPWSMKLVLHGHMFLPLLQCNAADMKKTKISKEQKKVKNVNLQLLLFLFSYFLGGNITCLPASPPPPLMNRPPQKKLILRG